MRNKKVQTIVVNGRTIYKTKAGDLILDPYDPLGSAHTFRDLERPNLIRYQDECSEECHSESATSQ